MIARPFLAVSLVAAHLLYSSPARSDEPPTHPAPAWTGVLGVTDLPSFLLFAGGALSGLALHEMGHVTANLAYGNVPGLKGIVYAHVIPWFVIDSRLTLTDGVYYKRDGSVFVGGGRAYYVINTAGFMVQNLGSEIILSMRPRIFHEHAPLLKGLLWMNMLLSIGYGGASLLGVEDVHGDIYGGARHSGYPHQLIAGVVLSNGALDMLRYFLPDSPWLAWLSRASKLALFGLDRPYEY
jgi:hypothetical protein